MKKFSMFFLGLLILNGCATPYQSGGFRGGYSDMRLQDNIFRIDFRGNGYTSGQRATDFALLHSAEVTVRNGYNYFIILNLNQSTETTSYTTPVTANTTGMLNANSYTIGNMGTLNGTYSGQTTYYGGNTVNIYKPQSSLIIACFTDKPQTNAYIYEAHQIMSNIGGAYGITSQTTRPNAAQKEVMTIKAEAEAVCKNDEFKVYYAKSPCMPKDMTLEQMTDSTKITDNEKVVFSKARGEMRKIFEKRLAVFRKYGGSRGEETASTEEHLQSLFDKNALDLYEGKQTWGEYNKRRKELSDQLRDAENQIRHNSQTSVPTNSPSPATDSVKQAMSMYNQGNYAGAITLLNTSLQANPSFEEIYIARGLVYGKQGYYEKAVSDFNSAISINPQNPVAYMSRGSAYGDKGDYDLAISDFTKVLNSSSESLEAVKNKGFPSMLNKKDFDIGALEARGSAYFGKKDYDNAISDFTKVIDGNPDAKTLETSCYGRARAYSSNFIVAIGNHNATLTNKYFDLAIKDCEKVIELNPKSADAYSLRGTMYCTKKDYDKCWENIHQAQSLGANLSKDFLDGLRKASGRQE